LKVSRFLREIKMEEGKEREVVPTTALPGGLSYQKKKRARGTRCGRSREKRGVKLMGW